MTTQEEQMLRGLAERVNRTQVQDKDEEADQFIRQNIGTNPDALYILSQTTLVQEYALNQAQRQIADLRAQLQQAQRQIADLRAQLQQAQQQPKHTGSFLGNLLGHRDEPQRTTPPPPPPAPRSPVGPPPTDPVSGVGPGLAYPAGGYPIPGAAVGYGAPQGGGFLRGALQTATGVAAGALAFQGIESLLDGFGGHSGFGGFGGPGYVEERPEIVNNYYGDAGGAHEHTGMTDAGREFADSMGPQHTPLESDHNTGLNEGSYLGSSQADRDELAATGDQSHDRDQDAVGVGDDNVDYSANQDDSVTSDDVGQDFGDDDSDAGTDDGGGFDDGGGDFGGGDDFGSGDDGGGF